MEDDFKLKILEIQQMQKEASSELPLSDEKQELLGTEAAINPLFWVAFTPSKDSKSKPT